MTNQPPPCARGYPRRAEIPGQSSIPGTVVILSEAKNIRGIRGRAEVHLKKKTKKTKKRKVL
jgi:hypothetical protein